ncbi:MAG TPA: elongation factor Ts, partial [Elainellaceae cyanobacterium]
PYIRDQSITVDELVKQTVAQLGENIQVRRFVRFVLGEGIEKEESDFAAEVAAQTSKAPEPKAQLAEPKAEAAPAPKPESTTGEKKKKSGKKKK